MSNLITYQLAQRLNLAAAEKLGFGEILKTPNEYLAKICYPAGNLCVYSNKKGEAKLHFAEIKDAASRQKIEEIFSEILTKGIPELPNHPSNLSKLPPPSETPPTKGELLAYTDGSAERGQCGWGLVIYGENNSEVRSDYGNLGPQSSNQIPGEVEAAIKAIKYALNAKAKSLEIKYDYRGIGMWNSASNRKKDDVLKSEKQWKAKNPDAINLQKWVNYATSKGLDVQFVWTKSHVGTAGNELADSLALQGTYLPPKPRTGPPPRLEQEQELSLS